MRCPWEIAENFPEYRKKKHIKDKLGEVTELKTTSAVIDIFNV